MQVRAEAFSRSDKNKEVAQLTRQLVKGDKVAYRSLQIYTSRYRYVVEPGLAHGVPQVGFHKAIPCIECNFSGARAISRRSGEISASELQEYFAKVLGRGRGTEDLLKSIASLLPAGEGQESLIKAAEGTLKPLTSPPDDNWTSLKPNLATLSGDQLQEAFQAAEGSPDVATSTNKRAAMKDMQGNADLSG